MRRRDFIAFLGGAAAAWPLAARAQQPAMPFIGFIHSASPNYFAPFGDAFRAGLKETGYIERQNVGIEYRWAEGHYEHLPALVADLLDRKVNVIFAAGGTDPAKAAKAATTTTPIVFVSAADPVGTGLVESLNRPGGNITGVSLLASALGAKKLGLLRELVPQVSVFGSLINPSYPEAKSQSDEFQAAAERLGVQSIVLSAGTDADIDNVFATLEQQHIALAARHSVPMMHFQREFVTAGGLISYGPHFADGYRQAAVYVGRVLKGEKPADLPVVQPTKFELVINVKTAKALGLTVPDTLLALADEAIE
jgi:putative ABC transport system substrate-binding protein